MEFDNKKSTDYKEAKQIELVSSAEIDIAEYSSLELLAEGATGFVYSARRNADDRQVAIKIYKKELVPDSESAKRFEHEVSALQSISHPNIVEIIDAGQTVSGLSFIVMEKIEGVSIRSSLDTEGVFELRRAVIVMREVCRALQALHAKQIIHRDIKPNNIILDENNVARLVDFGIAKVLSSSNDTLSHYGTILGTPAYMSPEQCLGQKVDVRSDIYSVGCTLFEMLTGTQAFASVTAMEALAKQIDSDRSFIEKPLVSAGAPPDLRQIVLRCLSREPDARYNSVDELDHELSAFLLGKPLSFPAVKLQKKQSQPPDQASNQVHVKKWQVIACCAALIGIGIVVKFNLDSISQVISAQVPGSSATNSNAMSWTGLPGPFTIVDRFTRKPIWVDTRAARMGDAIINAAAHGVSLHNADLHGAMLRTLNLGKADLSNADLSHADLTSSILIDVNLHGANFSDAQLLNTEFSRDDCSAAQFVSARMRMVRTLKSNFQGTNLSFADMSDARCTDTNFSNANFTKSHLAGTVFDRVDLSFANFTDSYFRYSSYNFKNSNLFGAKNFPPSTSF